MLKSSSNMGVSMALYCPVKWCLHQGKNYAKLGFFNGKYFLLFFKTHQLKAIFAEIGIEIGLADQGVNAKHW